MTQLYLVKVYTEKNADGTFNKLGPWHWHTGGRGNGATANAYKQEQLARITGRYNKGQTLVVPVAQMVTEERLEELAEDSHFLSCLECQGVDNWQGYEYAQEQFREETDGLED